MNGKMNNNNNNGKNNSNKQSSNQSQKSRNSNGKKGKQTKTFSNEGSQKIVTLGRCTSDYARTLGNPKSGPLTCVPVAPAQFSKKVRTWSKGTFDVQSSNGIGWIMASPDFAVDNVNSCIITSNPTGTSATWFDYPNPASNAVVNFSNSEYPDTAIGPGANQFEYRIVSSVLQIRYIGTELNRSGQKVCLMDSNHKNLVSRTLGSLDGEETSRRFPVDRSWTKVLYRGVDESDFDFHDTLPLETGSPLESTYYMGVAIQATTGVSTPYEYEFYTTYEIFGRNIRAMTPSHVDAAGFGAVHAVGQLGTNLFPTKLGDQELEAKMVQDTVRYVAEQSTTFSHTPRSSQKNPPSQVGLGDAVGNAVVSGLTLFNTLSYLL